MCVIICVFMLWACMGDLISADVAQACHKAVLRFSEKLEYGKPAPKGPMYVLGVVLKRPFDSDEGRDLELLRNSRAAYSAAQRPAGQPFDKPKYFTVWGTEVDSDRGRVGAPVERGVLLFYLTALRLVGPGVSESVLRSSLGSSMHPLIHRLSASAFSCLTH